MPRVVPSDVVAAIDRLFPEMGRNLGADPHVGFDQVASVLVVARLVDAVPADLLILEPRQYAELTACAAYLRAVPDMFAASRGYRAMPLIMRGYEGNPIALIRAAMAACPDEATTVGTAPLPFIGDLALRESIRLDISGAHRDLAQGEWKGATVLAGAAVEALLLSAIQNREQQSAGSIAAAGAALVAAHTLGQRPNANPERWELHEYVEVARHLQLIEQETATQAQQARSFRNLIHPGRATRLGQKCDQGTALSALAAVHLVVRDLTPP